jgi:hypothetical protein
LFRSVDNAAKLNRPRALANVIALIKTGDFPRQILPPRDMRERRTDKP